MRLTIAGIGISALSVPGWGVQRVWAVGLLGGRRASAGGVEL